MTLDGSSGLSVACPFCQEEVEGDAAQLDHLVKCNPGHLIEVLERRYGSAWHRDV